MKLITSIIALTPTAFTHVSETHNGPHQNASNPEFFRLEYNFTADEDIEDSILENVFKAKSSVLSGRNSQSVTDPTLCSSQQLTGKWLTIDLEDGRTGYYLMPNEVLNFRESKKYCKSFQNTHLWSPYFNDENVKVYKAFGSQNMWLGSYRKNGDSSDWYRVEPEDELQFYQFWGPGQPNNRQNKNAADEFDEYEGDVVDENCAMTWTAEPAGSWNDAPYIRLFPFVCAIYDDCTVARVPATIGLTTTEQATTETSMKTTIIDTDLSEGPDTLIHLASELHNLNFPNITNHGCQCSRFGAHPHAGGFETVDNIDAICQDWLKARRCSKLRNGSCEGNVVTEVYELLYDQKDEDSMSCELVNSGNECLYDTCLIDLKFVDMLAHELEVNGFEFSTGSDEICTRHAGTRLMEVTCEGDAPDVRIEKVL